MYFFFFLWLTARPGWPPTGNKKRLLFGTPSLHTHKYIDVNDEFMGS